MRHYFDERCIRLRLILKRGERSAIFGGGKLCIGSLSAAQERAQRLRRRTVSGKAQLMAALTQQSDQLVSVLLRHFQPTEREAMLRLQRDHKSKAVQIRQAHAL
jgi:hypothetical protein